MSTHTDPVQIIKDPTGKPIYALVPYEDYLDLSAVTEADFAKGIPHKIVGKVAVDGESPAKAWREHLGLTQAEVAEKMGIKQPTYARLEAQRHPKKKQLIKLADALGLHLEQIDL